MRHLIALLIVIACTCLVTCVDPLGPEPDFAQVRVYNASDSTIAVATDSAGYRVKPGDSIDAVFYTGGLQRVTVYGDDTVDAYFDVTTKHERSFLRVR